MKTWKLFAVAGCLAGGFLGFLAPSSVSAQVNRSELQSMPMWPTGSGVNWIRLKNFTHAGDFDYYLDTTPNTPTTGPTTANSSWRYAYYTGLRDKRVTIEPLWGKPDIPPRVYDPAIGQYRDSCGHTHISYGVWLQYSIYVDGKSYQGWYGPFGGSKSGVRVNNNSYCDHLVDNPLADLDETFGWGADNFVGSFSRNSVYHTMVFGVTAVSHASLGCSSFGCVNNPLIMAYTSRL